MTFEKRSRRFDNIVRFICFVVVLLTVVDVMLKVIWFLSVIGLDALIYLFI